MDAAETARKLLTPVVEKQGYRLFEASLTSDKEGLTLHLVVDRDDPISLDDIVSLSDVLNPILDENDPIKTPYTLDISSLGAEKPLDPAILGECVGKYVCLHLSHPFDGKNILEGEIKSADEEKLILAFNEKGRKKEAILPRVNVDKARLAIKF